MAKKEKTRKKTANEIKFINAIKDYLNKYYAKSNLIKNIEFSEKSVGDFLCFIAKLDYGAFTQMIEYCPSMQFRQDYIDVEFFFKNSKNIYTFYDIFNLFDIDDFELYYYEGVLSVSDMENALNEILNATEEYFHYFEKAQTSEYLPILKKNYESDMNGAYGSENWKKEEDFFQYNHPAHTFAGGQITPEMIKDLKELDADGELATLYERRLLEYLERNPKFTRKNLFDKENFEKLYKKTFVKTYGLLFLIPVIAVFALTFLIHSVIFKDTVVLETQVKISYCLGAAVMYAMAIMIAFGEMLVVKSMPQEHRERTKVKMESTYGNMPRANKKPGKVATVVIFIFTALLATVLFAENLSDVGYYENGVKFMSSPFKLCDVPYEELDICKIQGYYDKNNKYHDYENTYAIYSGDDHFILYDIKPDGEAQKKLEEIAEKYNKEIKEFKTTDEL